MMLVRSEALAFCCLYYSVLADIPALPFYSQYLLSYLHLRDSLSLLPLMVLFLALQLLLLFLGTTLGQFKYSKYYGIILYLVQLGIIVNRREVVTLVLLSMQSWLLGALYPMVQVICSTFRPTESLHRLLLLSGSISIFIKTNLIQSLVNTQNKNMTLFYYGRPIYEECVSENVHYILYIQTAFIVAMLCLQPEVQVQPQQESKSIDQVHALQMCLWYYSMLPFKMQTRHLSDYHTTLFLSSLLLVLAITYSQSSPRVILLTSLPLILLLASLQFIVHQYKSLLCLVLHSLLLRQLGVSVSVPACMVCFLGSVGLMVMGEVVPMEVVVMIGHMWSAVLLLRR